MQISRHLLRATLYASFVFAAVRCTSQLVSKCAITVTHEEEEEVGRRFASHNNIYWYLEVAGAAVAFGR